MINIALIFIFILILILIFILIIFLFPIPVSGSVSIPIPVPVPVFQKIKVQDQVQYHIIPKKTYHTIPLEDLRNFQPDDQDNVHNRSIKTETCRIIEDLIKNRNNVEHKPKFSIESILRNENDQSLLKTYNQIKEMKCKYLSYKEIDIINIIWERLCFIDHHGQCIDIFKSALSDCQEGNNSVCCIDGRIARFIQCLQHIDPSIKVNYVPLWLARKLIIDKIAIVQDVAKLKAIFDEEYISTGILTQSQLNEIVSPFYDEIELQLSENDASTESKTLI